MSDSRIIPTFDGQVVTLLLKNVSPKDIGSYKCVVSNSVGTSSSNAGLKVEKKALKPNIIEKLRDTKGVQGDEATFVIKVDGEPKPDVEWFRGSIPLTDDRKHTLIESGNTYSLVIKDLDDVDAGLYKCVTSNDEGKAESRANLEVSDKQFPPEIDDDSFKAVRLNEGEELEETVKIRGAPQPEVVWYKDGKRLRESNRLDLRSIGSSHNIYIRKALPEDSGEYKCVATNVKGTSHKIFDVKVKGILLFLRSSFRLLAVKILFRYSVFLLVCLT